MYQGEKENDETWLARTLKRRDVFQRRVVWQREEGPNKPWKRPAGSTTDCPGPPEGGPLDFTSCKMAVLQTLSSEECSAVLAVLCFSSGNRYFVIARKLVNYFPFKSLIRLSSRLLAFI